MSLDTRYIGLDSGLAQYVPPPASGGLTSVGLAMPAPFVVTGSPLTADGTIGVAALPQSASSVWAAPPGGGVPVFRILDPVDIPALDAAKVTSGVFTTARLGNGAPSAGTFLRGDSQWAAVPGAVPGGAPSQVQYNAAGAFGGSAAFTFNAPTGQLALATSNTGNAMTVSALGLTTTGLAVTRSAGTAAAIMATGPAQTGTSLLTVSVTTPGALLDAALGYTGAYGDAAVAGITRTPSLIGVLAAAQIGDTNTVQTPLVIGHDTTAFASIASGYGVGTAFRLRTATTSPIAGQHYVSWLDPADGATSSQHTWTTVHAGGPLTERLRLLSDGELRIGTSVVYVGLRPAASGTPTFTLPGAAGTNGQVLTTDGAGGLSWTTGYVDPLSINGDLLVRSGGVTTRLAIGTNGQHLVVATGVPTWQTPTAGYVDPLTTAGDLLYFDASTTRLAIGSLGQFLRVSATGRPAWQTVSLYTDPLADDDTSGDRHERYGTDRRCRSSDMADRRCRICRSAHDGG
ncbi:MAG: hypothetical protein J0I17_11215 ['Candidatus Kapabacteria' thiocyanatum]|nr:hypothetical protein ['Candidatus Kapabacteria' thiocyanatum]